MRRSAAAETERWRQALPETLPTAAFATAALAAASFTGFATAVAATFVVAGVGMGAARENGDRRQNSREIGEGLVHARIIRPRG